MRLRISRRNHQQIIWQHIASLPDGRTAAAAAALIYFWEIICCMACSRIISSRFPLVYSKNLNHLKFIIGSPNWERNSMFSSSKNNPVAEGASNTTSEYLYLWACSPIHLAMNSFCVTQMRVGLKMRNFQPDNEERSPAVGKNSHLATFSCGNIYFENISHRRFFVAFGRPTYVWKAK